ncbi:unnamed protein product [Candida verbasci]|uniref:chitinase n=1 Tax=Candida verbasci TaxID=1227364 RepID=A0A9W4TQ89_9ASCO|nr:unnamed protein product [Candida verbasci]
MFLILLSLIIPILAFNSQSNSNIAVYWGQNSGGNQQRLSYYCNSENADIFIISFMHVFPQNLQLNFANACEGTYTSSGLLQCQNIAEDIKTCQSQGKKVLLSLGGAAGSYGFSSDSQAIEFADTLWDLFGNSKNVATNDRPFFDSVLDGFDFDIENNNQIGYSALANELRKKFATDSSKQYYLGAAPQCPYPDASVGNLLLNSYIDFVFIQFYNNYCNLGSTNFNWNTWFDYAENSSPNKDVKLFIGVPGAARAAGSGYNDPSVIESDLTSDILNNVHFGGISMWDVSAAYGNVDNQGVNFVENMKRIVSGAGGNNVVNQVVDSDSTTSTTTTTTTITSTTTIPTTTIPTTSSTKSSTSSSLSSTRSSTSSSSIKTSSSSSSSVSSSSSSSVSTSSSSSVSTSSSSPILTRSIGSILSSSSISSSPSSVEISTSTSSAPPILAALSSSSSSISSSSSSSISSSSSSSSSSSLLDSSTSDSSVTSALSTTSIKDVLSISSTTSTSSDSSSSSSSSSSESSESSSLTPTTIQNIYTSIVYAPTTFSTITTFYEMITTRTHIQTVYGRPQTTTILN